MIDTEFEGGISVSNSGILINGMYISSSSSRCKIPESRFVTKDVKFNWTTYGHLEDAPAEPEAVVGEEKDGSADDSETNGGAKAEDKAKPTDLWQLIETLKRPRS
jgi:hypothetical protein